MTTSQKESTLSEKGPISEKRLAYFRRRLQNRFHAVILKAFAQQEGKNGLNQKELARRIRRKPEVVNRWLIAAGNWELDTISDLLLGMKVDIDDPTFTPIEELVRESKGKSGNGDRNGRSRPERIRSPRRIGGIRASIST